MTRLPNSPDFVWSWRRFDALSVDDVYDLLALRAGIFVVEQACVFLDPDGADRASWHLLGRESGGGHALGAYLRAIDAGIKYDEPSIGRVAIAEHWRGQGAGRALMLEGLRRTTETWPGADIVIGAQQRLEGFYRSLGFRTEGPPYLEDGIDHVKMRRRARDDAGQTRVNRP